jgi:outer membrane protein TolC
MVNRFCCGYSGWLLGLLLMMALPVMAEPLLLEQAVAIVEKSNPGLAAIKARAEALAALPDQAGALPDPRLSLNLVNMPLDTFSFTQEGMTQLQIGFSQALPYPGKLGLQSQVARHEALAAEAEVAEKRLQLLRDVKNVWWNLFYLDHALATVEENQSLLDQFVGLAETRYQVGQGLQQDVLLAQLALSRLSDGAIRLHSLRQRESIRLNLLLDQPPSTLIQLPETATESLPKLLPLEQLLANAEQTRPLLSAQQQRVDAARNRHQLARKEQSPDFMLGAVYGLRSGENPDGSERADFASILFSMNLPIYSDSKQARLADQRNAEWIQQRFQMHEQHNQVAAEVSQAVSDYVQAGEQVLLYRDEIIPQALQTVEAMLAGYQVGKVDFHGVVQSQTTLHDYQTQYWKALSMANQALAALMAAVGEEQVYE